MAKARCPLLPWLAHEPLLRRPRMNTNGSPPQVRRHCSSRESLQRYSVRDGCRRLPLNSGMVSSSVKRHRSQVINGLHAPSCTFVEAFGHN